MAFDYGISDVCAVTIRDGNGNIVAEFPEATIKFKEVEKLELTREQAISEFRKHWQWQAENPMKEKREYPEFENKSVMWHCFLCDFTNKDNALKPTTPPPAPAKYSIGDKVRIKEGLVPDELYDGVRMDAEMLSLCGKEGVIKEIGKTPKNGPRYKLAIDGKNYSWSFSDSMLDPAPRFHIGDRVVPVSKSVPGYESSQPLWSSGGETQGFLLIKKVEQNLTKKHGKFVYECNLRTGQYSADYYFESDLIPYVEPAKTPEPRPFQVGDRVRSIGEIAKGNIGTIKKLYTEDCTVEFDAACTGYNFPGYKPGHACIKKFVNLELLPPINCAPEDYELTESTTFTFKGNKTTCVIKNELGTFKGCAKCSPTDEWQEDMGKAYAFIRASRKVQDAMEKKLRGE